MSQDYVRHSIASGVYHQHKRVLEMQRDFRRRTTGKRTTTYNQYQKQGGKQWMAFKAQAGGGTQAS